MTFRDFLINKNQENRLLESPVKMIGDAPFETLDGRNKSLRDFHNEWFKIGDINSYEVYQSRKFDIIIVGMKYVDDIIKDERFGIVAELSYKSDKFRSTNSIINNKDVIRINTIQVKESVQKEKIASKLYRLLLETHMVISDKVQYEGAVNLWKSFTKVPGLKIWIYDSIEDKIISKFTKNTPDEHVWSQDKDYSKHRIQLILGL